MNECPHCGRTIGHKKDCPDLPTEFDCAKCGDPAPWESRCSAWWTDTGLACPRPIDCPDDAERVHICGPCRQGIEEEWYARVKACTPADQPKRRRRKL